MPDVDLLYSSIDPMLIQDICEDCPQTTPPLPPGPEQVIFVVTDRCNNRCPTCDYWRHSPSSEAGPELGTAEIAAIITELAPLGLKKVVLTGGEPLLRKDVFRICEMLVAAGVEPLLLTNGTLIGPDHVRAIESIPQLKVITSWDGWDRDTFDAACGRPHAFARFHAALTELCDRRGLGHRVGVNITVTRTNLRQLETIVRQVAALGIRQLHLHLVYTRVRSERFSPEEIAALPGISDRVERLAVSLGITRIINQIPFAFIRSRHCFIPYTFCTIGPRGEVFGCIPSKGGFHDDSSKSLASLRFSTFSEVWNGSAYADFRSDAVAGRHEECIACLACHAARNFTSGPCRACAQRPRISFAPTAGASYD